MEHIINIGVHLSLIIASHILTGAIPKNKRGLKVSTAAISKNKQDVKFLMQQYLRDKGIILQQYLRDHIKFLLQQYLRIKGIISFYWDSGKYQ